MSPIRIVPDPDRDIREVTESQFKIEQLEIKLRLAEEANSSIHKRMVAAQTRVGELEAEVAALRGGYAL